MFKTFPKLNYLVNPKLYKAKKHVGIGTLNISGRKADSWTKNMLTERGQHKVILAKILDAKYL